MRQVSLYSNDDHSKSTVPGFAELLELSQLFCDLPGGVAACSDVLDSMGYKSSVMNSRIKPCFEDKGRMCGPAYTIRGGSIPGLPPKTPEVRPTVDVEFYDGIRDGVVLAYGTELTEEGTILGDVIASIASKKGAVGAVADGFVRDLERIKGIDFNIFSAGASPKSGEGRILWIEYDCIVQVGGVWVEPFDIIFGDSDGVIVIPKHIASAVYEQAKAIGEKERAILTDLNESNELSTLELFTKHARRA